MNIDNNEIFDAFLSHSHEDADIVHDLANRLKKEGNYNLWLDKWTLIPGKPFIQEMAKGIENAKSCIVFIGKNTPQGWFKQEIDKALNKQAKDNNFSVIPVLLPKANEEHINDFLELRTWVKFKNSINDKRAIWELLCGINKTPPGQKYLKIKKSAGVINPTIEKLKKLDKLSQYILPAVKEDIQKTIVLNYLELNERK